MAIQIIPDPLSLLRPVTKVITVSKVRPANVTAYAAGQIVADSTTAATLWSFAGVARANGLGAILQSVELIDSVAQTLKPDLELWLFDTAPSTTAQNDAQAWAPTDAEMKFCLGYVALATGAFKTAGPNGVIAAEGLAKPLQCTAASVTVFGVLVVRNAYVPASAEELTLRMIVVQD